MTASKPGGWGQKLSIGGGAIALVGLGLTHFHRPADVAAPSTAFTSPSNDPAAVDPGPAAVAPAPAPTEAPLSSADDSKPHDKGWVLESTTPQADGAGGLTTIARLKNVHLTSQTGVFTVTLMHGGAAVAAFQGSATGVQPGQVVTVEMVTDATVAKITSVGSISLDFQTDATTDG